MLIYHQYLIDTCSVSSGFQWRVLPPDCVDSGDGWWNCYDLYPTVEKALEGAKRWVERDIKQQTIESFMDSCLTAGVIDRDTYNRMVKAL